ncbi:uncharacterized protein AMSG_11380 [Thecamonas trahens ATCC 50062]|uniref:Uncharacterized protein n=1 Tax=Thecamonas trahens ATCC 50062 TaxID=461836 RepID=A0A0L0DWK7_THETB|nr:hypothetical protein AMSG_11380 [Thecamonas trahens ATCC 50062]KNC55913.1 hypothetical protein AMSG_11380 [Thecamonas trahens ATCC 50062]|eukprot:XP_013752731.1 hypothetical protein AMSG_11380 [Thecamonas trahens ATCC 50062]
MAKSSKKRSKKSSISPPSYSDYSDYSYGSSEDREEFAHAGSRNFGCTCWTWLGWSYHRSRKAMRAVDKATEVGMYNRIMDEADDEAKSSARVVRVLSLLWLVAALIAIIVVVIIRPPLPETAAVGTMLVFMSAMALGVGSVVLDKLQQGNMTRWAETVAGTTDGVVEAEAVFEGRGRWARQRIVLSVPKRRRGRRS